MIVTVGFTSAQWRILHAMLLPTAGQCRECGRLLRSANCQHFNKSRRRFHLRMLPVADNHSCRPASLLTTLRVVLMQVRHFELDLIDIMRTA